MADSRLRDLERRFRETGAVADEGAYLAERVRAGDLDRDRLVLAAYCEHPAAREALGSAAPQVDRVPAPTASAWALGLDIWRTSVGSDIGRVTWGKQLAARINALAGQHVAGAEPDEVLRGALFAALDWIDCPCEGHATEAQRASDAASRVAQRRPRGADGSRAWAILYAASVAGAAPDECGASSWMAPLHAANASSDDSVREAIRRGLIPWLLDAAPFERAPGFCRAVSSAPARTPLRKPVSLDDLRPPFERIGEQGWADRVRGLLDAYGVPLPAPVAADELDARRAELGVELPPALRTFLTEIGPLDPREIRILPPAEIVSLDGVWFRDHLGFFDRRRLRGLIAVGDYLGSGDFIALEPKTGRCCLCSHDPPGFSSWLPDFDSVVKVILVNLACGYYGWPDEEVSALADELKETMFGFRPF